MIIWHPLFISLSLPTPIHVSPPPQAVSKGLSLSFILSRGEEEGGKMMFEEELGRKSLFAQRRMPPPLPPGLFFRTAFSLLIVLEKRNGEVQVN